MEQHDYSKLCRDSAKTFRDAIALVPSDENMVILEAYKLSLESIARDYETMALVFEQQNEVIRRLEAQLKLKY